MTTLSRTRNFFSSLGASLSRSRAGESRLRKISDLGARSDVELADMGLVRSDLARHAYRDIYYI